MVAVLRLVQDCKEAIVLFMRDRVVFVGVALSTSHGHPHPDLHGGVDPIDNGRDTKLLIVCAAFAVRHGIAMKCRGDQLVLGGVIQHVSRNLLNREFIERHVRVQGFDHPVTISPDGSRRILRITLTVGIPCEIQPDCSPAFTERW